MSTTIDRKIEPDYNINQYRIVQKYLNIVSYAEHQDIKEIVSKELEEERKKVKELEEKMEEQKKMMETLKRLLKAFLDKFAKDGVPVELYIDARKPIQSSMLVRFNQFFCDIAIAFDLAVPCN